MNIFSKRQGASLIECIASMAVIMITFIGTISCTSLFSKLTYIAKEKYINHEINELFSFGENYCFYNNTHGNVELYNNGDINNQIEFKDEHKSIKKIVKLPEYITFEDGYPEFTEFIINSDGKIVPDKKIVLRYKKSKDIIVTIKVSSNDVE